MAVCRNTGLTTELTVYGRNTGLTTELTVYGRNTGLTTELTVYGRNTGLTIELTVYVHCRWGAYLMSRGGVDGGGGRSVCRPLTQCPGGRHSTPAEGSDH